MNRLRCPSCGLPTIEDALEDVADDELLCNRCDESAEIASQVNREFCRIRIEDRDVWKAIIKSKDEGFADALLALFDLLGDER